MKVMSKRLFTKIKDKAASVKLAAFLFISRGRWRGRLRPLRQISSDFTPELRLNTAIFYHMTLSKNQFNSGDTKGNVLCLAHRLKH